MCAYLQVTPEVLKARQRAKAQAWEVELKAKKQMVPPVHLGCFWLDNPCVCAKHLDILKQFEVSCYSPGPRRYVCRANSFLITLFYLLNGDDAEKIGACCTNRAVRPALMPFFGV